MRTKGLLAALIVLVVLAAFPIAAGAINHYCGQGYSGYHQNYETVNDTDTGQAVNVWFQLQNWWDSELINGVETCLRRYTFDIATSPAVSDNGKTYFADHLRIWICGGFSQQFSNWQVVTGTTGNWQAEPLSGGQDGGIYFGGNYWINYNTSTSYCGPQVDDLQANANSGGTGSGALWIPSQVIADTTSSPVYVSF